MSNGSSHSSRPSEPIELGSREQLALRQRPGISDDNFFGGCLIQKYGHVVMFPQIRRRHFVCHQALHGEVTAQELHIEDMICPIHWWQPDRLAQFNVMIAGIEFTESNGAAHVVPGGRKWPEAWREIQPEEVARATMTAGSAVFFPGQALHGGGANTDGTARRAIVASYVLGFLRT